MADLTPELRSLFGRLYSKPQIKVPKKWFELRQGTGAVRENERLSEIAIVAEQTDELHWEADGVKFRFGDGFETFVGQALPMGIGPHRPGMILVAKRFGMKSWEVIACYLDFKHPKLLWRQPDKPRWLGGNNGNAS